MVIKQKKVNSRIFLGYNGYELYFHQQLSVLFKSETVSYCTLIKTINCIYSAPAFFDLTRAFKKKKTLNVEVAYLLTTWCLNTWNIVSN